MSSTVAFSLVSMALVFVAVAGGAESPVTFGRTIDPPKLIARGHDVLLENTPQADIAALHLRSSNAKPSISETTTDDKRIPEIDCSNDLLSMEMKLLCHYYSQY